MTSLAEIEAAITQLPEVEARNLLEWLQAYLDDAWDRQMEADAKSGRLDKLIQRAETDIAANRVLALKKEEDYYWIWIGPHSDYDRLIG